MECEKNATNGIFNCDQRLLEFPFNVKHKHWKNDTNDRSGYHNTTQHNTTHNTQHTTHNTNIYTVKESLLGEAIYSAGPFQKTKNKK